MHSPFSFWNSLKFLIAVRGHYTSYKRNYPESSGNSLYEAYGRSEGHLRSREGIKLHGRLYLRSRFEGSLLSNLLEKRHCQHLPSMVQWNSGKHSWQEWRPPLFCTRKGIHKRGGGVNDSVEEMRKIRDFLRDSGGAERVELLPYHDMGRNKCNALGIDFHPFSVPEEDKLRELQAVFSPE